MMMRETRFLQMVVAAAILAGSAFVIAAFAYVDELGPPAYALSNASKAIASIDTPAQITGSMARMEKD